MTEVVQPLLPPRYNDENGFLDYVETDPTTGVYTVPDNYAARLRWLAGFYQQDGTANPLIVTLNLLPNIDAASEVKVPAIRPGVVGGFVRVVFSPEIGTPSFLPESATTFTAVSLNPLPIVTLSPGGHISVGFNNCDRLEPDQLSVELFPQEGVIPGQQANADLYLLPALG